MPTILRVGPYRFFFYSNENFEPPHIHIETDGKTAKYWLKNAELAHSHGFSAHELNRIREIVVEHRIIFLEGWHAHFKR